jgi:uncharacterized protein (DUF1330 family)
VRGGKTIGDPAPTGRVVIYAFESLAKLEALIASPEWQEVSKIGEKYATVDAIGVEGVD